MPFEGLAKLVNEKVGRPTVEDEVVYIHQQRYSLFGSHHLEATEWCFLQIEGLYEIILIDRQLLCTHLRNGNLDRNAIFNSLHYLLAFSTEVHAQFRMAFYHLFHSIDESTGICSDRECEHIRDIVYGRSRIL